MSEAQKHPCVSCKEFPSMMCRSECEEYNAWHVREEMRERAEKEEANAQTR